MDRIKIPKEIANIKKTVFFTAGVFFVNRIPFFVSLSRKIDFTGVSRLKVRTVEIIFDAFKAVFRLYIQKGFHIQTVHVNDEFGVLKYLIQNTPAGPRVNLTSANKHVTEIERRIHVVKDRSHAFFHSLMFNLTPKLMTIHAILNIAKMLNYFPTKEGIFSELSPCSILTGESLDYKKKLTLHPGKYCQLHENEVPWNSDKARTKGSICIGSCGNLQGGFKFISLQTGQNITRYNWD